MFGCVVLWWVSYVSGSGCVGLGLDGVCVESMCIAFVLGWLSWDGLGCVVLGWAGLVRVGLG